MSVSLPTLLTLLPMKYFCNLFPFFVSILSSFPLCALWLHTMLYRVLCFQYSWCWILICYVLCILICSIYLYVYTGDQRETSFQSRLCPEHMLQLTIKLTLTHTSKRPLSLNRLLNNTSTRGQRKVVSSDNNEHGSSGGGYDNVPVKKVSPQKNSTIIEISTSCPMAI